MTRGPLCEMVPIENASMEDRTVIEWDKDDIDALGILKVDVLALGMLTCISKVFEDADAKDRSETASRPFPPKDPARLRHDLRCRHGRRVSDRIAAQMSMLPRLRPRKFYDLVIEVAIVRPGPIQGNMVHPYLRRAKLGEEKVELSQRSIAAGAGQNARRAAVSGTGDGVVMVAADSAPRKRTNFAGRWRRGDERRASTSFTARSSTACSTTATRDEFAEQCFKQIQGFGEYGFPESHAASFALLVYASRLDQAPSPRRFRCGLLNSQPMGFYAPAQIVRDAQDHGVEVRSM